MVTCETACERNWITLLTKTLKEPKCILASRPIKFGQASGTCLYWLNNVLSFRKQIPVDLSHSHRGRVHVYIKQLRSQLPHFDRIRSGSESSRSCYLLKPFSLFSLTSFKTCVSVFGWLYGDPAGLVVRVLASCQKLQKGWGTHHHELTSQLCKLYLSANY